MKIMKYAERVSERGIKEFDKLTEEVEGLMDMRESKTLRPAMVAGRTTDAGVINGLKRNIRFLKKLKRNLIKFIKEVDRLIARYG